jgi:hypothetical protein
MVQALEKLFLALTLAAAILLTGPFAHAEKVSFEAKGDSLRYLQELRNKESKQLLEINETLSHKMESTLSDGIDKEVGQLKTAQLEHQMRQEFLDRLIHQVDMNFRGGDLRAFLQKALVEMAKIDAITSAQSGHALWKFLRYSADAIRSLPEQKENILAFLEGYMNRSVSNPIPPQDYLASRNYTNGTQSEMGNTMTAEAAGSIADERIQEMGRTQGIRASK